MRSLGFMQTVSITPCNKCKGKGRTIEKPCESCRGKGKTQITKKIEVKIPKGVHDGQYLRIQGEGEPGDYGAPQGDLYVIVTVAPHKIFERKENDLFCKTTIDLGIAILGGDIEIPTPNGKAKLKIPQGTQSHTVFRLNGQGMPSINSSKRGDQFVAVVIDIPQKLNEKQKSALRELLGSERKQETSKGFFEKMKDVI